MRARDLMTTNPIAIGLEAPLVEAIDKMLDGCGQGSIGGMPVVDAHNEVVGILTGGDLLRRAELGSERHRAKWIEWLLGPTRAAHEYVRAHSRQVSDLMTRDVVTVEEETPVAEIVRLMEAYAIKQLPVLRDGTLIGVVSRADLVRALGRALRRQPRPLYEVLRVSGSAGKAAIDALSHLRAELEGKSWFTGDDVSIGIEGNKLVLEGLVYDDATHAALCAAARNIAGADAVEDHLVIWMPSTPSTSIQSYDEPESRT